MSSSSTGRLARRASNGACLLRPSLYQLPTPPSRLRRHAVITVRLQRTAKPPPPIPPVLAPPRLRDPARANPRAGSTYPAMRVYSTCPRVESPARPPQFQGTRGFVLQCAPRPACQRLLGRGATSSLLLFVQHLLTATYGVVLWWSTLPVVGGGTDVSLSRRLASTQASASVAA